MSIINKRLGQILIDSGLITEETLQTALNLQKKSGEKLGEVLVNNNFVTDIQILDAVKNQLKIQSINLDLLTINQNIIGLVPETMARKHEVLPIDLINGQLILVMADPLNYYAIEDIKVSTGYVVKPAIALRKSILNNIEKYYGKNKAIEAAESFKKNYGFKSVENREISMDNDEIAAPIINFLNTIIENAVINSASDIHIEPEEKNLRIRFRIDGILREIITTDIGMLNPLISRIKIMSNLNIAQKRIPQDGRIMFKTKGKNIDIRISIVPTTLGEKVVMRLFDKSNFSLSIESLGIDNKDIKKINSIISKPYGMILVSGPTGSGKTTSLYSLLNILNDVSKNLITIEDPVEYNFNGINQMQVNSKIDFTFAKGLRSILRQDPDIIMIGEIRDSETAEIATRSSLTGHLVLSTIHTNTAAGTITRLKDMGIEPFLLSSTVSCVISQRLVRKICPNCGKEYSSTIEEMKLLGISTPSSLKKGIGCPLCNNTGYKGRTSIYEIMEITPEIRALINNGASELEIEKASINSGMIKLKDCCANKVLNKITTTDEMIRVTYGY